MPCAHDRLPIRTYEYRRVRHRDEIKAYGEGWEFHRVYQGHETWYYFKRSRGDVA